MSDFWLCCTLLQKSELFPKQDGPDRSADGRVHRHYARQAVARVSTGGPSSPSLRGGEERDQGESAQPNQCQM